MKETFLNFLKGGGYNLEAFVNPEIAEVLLDLVIYTAIDIKTIFVCKDSRCYFHLQAIFSTTGVSIKPEQLRILGNLYFQYQI